MKDKIGRIIKDGIKAKEDLLKTQIPSIERAAAMISECLRSGGKVIVFGNGGSAADSQHMAAELVGRFKKERKALAAISLTTNTSSITAIANDYGYDFVFSRQIEAIGKPGDVAIGISTSGNSPNVLKAMEKAKAIGLGTIGITGGDGGKLMRACELAIVASANDTPRVQECHITVIHAICEIVEDSISG
jgi:D-sedoheptulose 7-phosphate isomerase